MRVNVHRQRWGFSLVELLVVIAILTILIALLLPAVQSARESSRRANCASNMHNVSTAVVRFETEHNRYPGHVETDRVNGLPMGRPWVHALLPYMEQTALHDQHQDYFGPGLDLTKDIPRLVILLCPSNEDDGPAPLHFVLNAGQLDYLGMDGCTYDSAPNANGVFTHMPDFTRQIVSPALVKDGTSSTLAVSENIQARNWSDMNERYISFLWFDSYDKDDPAKIHMSINKELAQGGSEAIDNTWARPSSNHPSVVNVTFLDNHLRTINDRIDYVVYAQLMTPNGKAAFGTKVAAAVRDYQLNDEDY